MRVAVLAATQSLARSIVAELGIAEALPLGRKSSARGFQLDALLIDESALPLTERAYDEIMPCLLGSSTGRVYELREHNPTS
ncbi:hypothetical protein SEA_TRIBLETROUBLE_91 [Mycobacterium Phage TribleTrouble]|nr:hypothetical protein SEA_TRIBLETROUBLE_91 [Mycobacterium Phage TribleTrouble]